MRTRRPKKNKVAPAAYEEDEEQGAKPSAAVVPAIAVVSAATPDADTKAIISPKKEPQLQLALDSSPYMGKTVWDEEPTVKDTFTPVRSQPMTPLERTLPGDSSSLPLSGTTTTQASIARKTLVA